MNDTTRCKFRCNQVTTHESGHKTVELSAVTGTGEENKRFWSYTPSGKLTFSYVNPDVTLTPGKEYYLDISEAQP